jgi:malate dehydrogenase (oxaloacetate-decarboxylating)
MNTFKENITDRSNPRAISGGLVDTLEGADVFIGVSSPNILSTDMVHSMAPHSIIFAIANPDPEILPNVAKKPVHSLSAQDVRTFPNKSTTHSFSRVCFGHSLMRAHIHPHVSCHHT